MQSLWPTLLAVLVYLSSLLGFTPAASAPQAGIPLPPATPAPAVSAPVVYPGATEVMAYYAERSSGDAEPYLSLNRAADKLTTVLPFAYSINAAGQIKGRANAKMLNLARTRGLKVLALLHNGGNGDFDSGVAHAFLSSQMARARAIEGVYALLVQTGFDGINLDFENVPASDRWNLTAFVRDLAARLRPGHFLVTASLPAKTRDELTNSWSGAFDYRALNPYLDQAILMTYDEHVAGGASGPVASLTWVEQVIRYALTAFPRQKIVLGLPAYGYVWSRNGDRAIDYGQAVALQQRYGVTPSWDYSAQAPYFVYYKGGVAYKVWYENNRSAAVKAAFVKEYGLRGVAVWRLGYEDPALWPVLAQRLR